MPSRGEALPIEKFLGLNRRDGLDLVANNEFLTLQNWYPKTKGLLYRKEGSVADVGVSDFPGASKIAGLYRYNDYTGKRSTLYYCQTDGTYIADPVTGGFTVTKGVNGTGGFGNTTYNVYISYVGLGRETNLTQVGSVGPTGNTAVSITVANSLTSFPTGVKSINVYIQDGVGTKDFAGVIYAPGQSITALAPWVNQIGYTPEIAKPTWCSLPDDGGKRYRVLPGGNLQPGTYYIACGWNTYTDPKVTAIASIISYKDPDSSWTDHYLIVKVEQPNSMIQVACRTASGADGAGGSYIHYYMGFKKPSQAPMQWVGSAKCLIADPVGSVGVLEITDIHMGTNAQSSPSYDGMLGSTGKNFAFFDPHLSQDSWFLGGNQIGCDFLMSKDSDGNVNEIMFSGSAALNYNFDPFTRKSNDAYPFSSNQIHANVLIGNIYLPQERYIAFQAFTGMCFISNGRNVLLQTDGFSMYETVTDPGTIQPGYPQDIQVLKSQLCAITKTADGFSTSARNRNQVFGTNALNPYNWVTGGTGSALRFATIGDGFADGLTALGVFSFNSATDGANSFLAAFKKASTWVISNIADPDSGVSGAANAISGRTGCVAPKTIVPTNMGLMFMGSDADIYLISSTGGEPRRIGNRVRALLDHLSDDEALMKRCTACFHKGFFKLSYPSTPTSTTNDAELWADMKTEQNTPITWSGPHIGVNVGPQIVLLGEGDPEIRVAAVDNQPTSAILNVSSTFQDLGVDVPAVIEWKTSRFRSMYNLKRFIGMIFDIYYDNSFNHDIRLECFADEQYSQINRQLSNGAAVWDASNFDQAQWGGAMFYPVTMLIGPGNLIGRTFRWKLTHFGNAQVILAGAQIFYNPERRMVVPGI